MLGQTPRLLHLPAPSRRFSVGLLLLWCCVDLRLARAQDVANPNANQTDLLSNPTVAKPAVSSGDDDHLLGDFGGARIRLADHGLTLNLIYTGEGFGNPTGGRRQGGVYDGLVEVGADVDFTKLLGWPGTTFHVNAYEIHGPSGTNKDVGDSGRFSNIDFYDGTRLFELWLEQSALGGKVSVRFGQLAADKEFFGSEVAALFVNSDFGVLPTISANMPVPIYGTAAPGIRVRVQPLEALYLQAAVFDGNPDPDTTPDPSPGFRPGTSYNHNGVKINLNDKEGAFSIYELGYRLNQGKDAHGLPGMYKLGGWYHTDTFSDLRSDRRGRSLADPASGGIPRAENGDWGGYLVIDQMIFPAAASSDRSVVDSHAAARSGGGGGKGGVGPSAQPSEDKDDRGLKGFLRVSGAPGDRNVISFYLDTGFDYKGLLPNREKDLVGVAFSCARFGDSVRALDRDRNFYEHLGARIRDEEIVVEASYQAVVRPYWSVQPDFQVIVHPGGTAAYHDAVVLGLRSVLTF